MGLWCIETRLLRKSASRGRSLLRWRGRGWRDRIGDGGIRPARRRTARAVSELLVRSLLHHSPLRESLPVVAGVGARPA